MSGPRFSTAQLVVASVVSGLVGAGIVGALGSRHKGASSGHAAKAVAPILAELEATGHGNRVASITALCQRETECDCARAALVEALDQEQQQIVLEKSEAAFDQCPSGELDGVKAEALARARSHEEAIRVASERLKDAPADPYALYALAHAYYVKGEAADTTAFLDKAIAAKRGEPAYLLAGLIAYQEQRYPAAEESFRAMLGINSESVAGLYNLGVTAVARDDYREARERFLAALRFDPKHQGSRYNLAIVTHARGAQAEAEHHLAEFAKLVDVADPRLAQLRARVAKPIVAEPAAVAPGAEPAPPASGAVPVPPALPIPGMPASPTPTAAVPARPQLQPRAITGISSTPKR